MENHTAPLFLWVMTSLAGNRSSVNDHFLVHSLGQVDQRAPQRMNDIPLMAIQRPSAQGVHHGNELGRR